MLSSAHPLFEDLPGTFADPLGLADQQAPGVVALIVARYDDTTTNASIASKTNTTSRRDSPHPPSPASGASDIPHPSQPPAATYDTFIAASGGLVAVTRTTPDYRFSVAPAAAVARFHAARDAGSPPALSLFAISETDAARFLETAFYAECLKVHVDGPASADLVRAQLERSGCQSGLLEANDFSDPATPTVRLEEISSSSLPDLDALLEGIGGRVLLYDRAKNQAVARDRAAAPLDLATAIAEADRLARARRPKLGLSDTTNRQVGEANESESPSSPLPSERSEPSGRRSQHPPSLANRQVGAASEASAVAATLRQRAEAPTVPSPLSALVAELQGRIPPPEAPEESPLSPGEDRDTTASSQPNGGTSQPGKGPATTSPPALPTEHPATSHETSEPRTRNSELAAAPPPQAAPHPLASDLDRLRTDAYALLEDAIGRDRAAALDAHVRAEHGWASPLPSEHTLDLLRALLLDDPPKRWHLFKRARAKTHSDIAALLLAFHAAHGHDARPRAQEAVMQATQLWTRLHR